MLKNNFPMKLNLPSTPTCHLQRKSRTHAPNADFKGGHIITRHYSKNKKYLKCTLTDQFKNKLWLCPIIKIYSVNKMNNSYMHHKALIINNHFSD